MQPVDLVNQALDEIGANTTIKGINPPLPAGALAAQVASRNYQTRVDAVFRAANWSCARRQIELSMLKAALGTPENPDGSLPQPPFPWQYEYGYPADCLKVRFLMPTPNLPTTAVPQTTATQEGYPPLANPRIPFIPAADFDDNGNEIKVILSNARAAQAVYTKRVDDPSLWDTQLVQCVIATLAAFFVNPLSRDRALMVEQTQIAVSLLQQARVADANEGISTIDHYPDFLRVRNVGGGVYTGLDGGSSLTGIGWTGYGGDWDSYLGADGIFY